MPSQTTDATGSRTRPLRLTALLTILFAGFALLPRVNANPHLLASFLTAAGCMVAGLGILWRQAASTGRTLTYEFVPRPVHWVQMIMHSCVYAYWGWYWREVYHELPLIAAQILFLYVLDMLVCWLRRDHWILGFGPIPIVLSTNLFLWFRDDWFYLQLAMIAIIVIGKEFVKWNREGELVHIFNPSAFALFLTSIALIVTYRTPITWGEQISTTFHRPPSIYLEIFLIGLIVQALFSVTSVTLSAAATLYILNVAYTGSTGMYHFIDTNIPPAVFLGLHLLVTDPATSPRKNFGKIVFGAGYGAGVFLIYGLLGRMGAPQFYDKLLCVPFLNLTVRFLDRASVALNNWVAQHRLRPLDWVSTRSGQQLNFACMGLWVGLFGFMSITGFLGGKQPGSDPAFWEKACSAGRKEACGVLAHTLDVKCQDNSARGCFMLGALLADGKEIPRDPVGAARTFGRACDLGFPHACLSFVELVKGDGDWVLSQPCNRGDGASCFMLGSLYHHGQGVAHDDAHAVALFRQSCETGYSRGCGLLGESYLFGQGVPRDMAAAKQILEKACDTGYGPGCFNTGLMYRQGIATPQNETLARAHFRHGCELGFRTACQALELSPSQARR
jgi:hypothetical protein